MKIRILGQLEIRDGVHSRTPTRRLARRLLGMLALKANTAVSVEWITEGLWNGRPPRSAGPNLRSYLAEIRRLLDGGGPYGIHVDTGPGGYLLRTEPEAMDALLFTTLVGHGRRHLAAGDHGLAAYQFGRALGLWRGQLFGGHDLPEVVLPEVTLLEGQRLDAFEDCVQARLALGQHTELIGELRGAIVEHELRERLWQQLMLALYLGGRQGEALAAYRRLHRLLDRELGVRPGPDTRELQRRILTGDPTLRAAAHGMPAGTAGGHPAHRHQPGTQGSDVRGLDVREVVPGQLPADVYGFAGRDQQLAGLDHILASATIQAPTAVVVCVLSGPAGVGKSALAVHWAHRIRRHFPDGQFHVDLRGHASDGRTTSPADAIVGFLDLLGVPADRVPASLDGRVGLYRSLLADKRVLVVLDDVRDADQIRTLIPGAPGCLVVVTSRDRLAPLVAAQGAHLVTVDALSTAEARDLLARRLGVGRITAEPQAAERIITRCARLPLALADAAARAAIQPGSPLTRVADELAGSEPAPDALAA